MHFFMKLFLAAPDSGFPSALTALPSQASRLHFFTKLVLAAPASGLPSALIALLSQDCAAAELTATDTIIAARIIRLIVVSSLSGACPGPRGSCAVQQALCYFRGSVRIGRRLLGFR